MFNWLIAIGAALLVGSAATFHFRTVQLRRDETQAGIAALSAVSWRSFLNMVLDALSRRGFARVVDAEHPSGDSDYVLQRNGEQWLLSCKHGSAFVLGRLTVNELARAIELKGAAGGFLVTQGRIAEEVRPVAALQRIELLDGPALWPQLRDLLPPGQLAGIRGKAAQAARQRILLSWLVALLAGVAVWLALPAPSAPAAVAGSGRDAPQVAADERPGDGTTPPPAQPQAMEARPPQAAPEPVAQNGLPDTERQRAEIAAAVSTLADVDRAIWSSESTLQVFLSTVQDDPFGRICPLVLRHDELAASRIQLTPPPGSGANVRFRQCRSY